MTTIQAPDAFCQLWKKCNQKHPWAGLYFRNKTFMGVGGQDFRDKLKNRAETGKCPIFQGLEVKFPQFVPEW